jgi:serine carboxypeptidase 1
LYRGFTVIQSNKKSLVGLVFDLVHPLQGGPGASSTGFGNFEELGPLDVDLKPRPYTWVKVANVLFVDNPVGTGYSYVTNKEAYTTDVEQIANDLVTAFKSILKTVPILKEIPFYIFCESYGGKMTTAFAVALQKAIRDGEVTLDFRGVALGDSWISPIDYVYAWGPYLHTMSLINDYQLAALLNVSKTTQQALEEGEFVKATHLWGEAEDLATQFSDDASFYNILLHHGNSKNLNFTSPDLIFLGNDTSGLKARLIARHLGPFQRQSLSALMNGPIREKLGIIPKTVSWGGQSGEVFSYQMGDFMKDVVKDVDLLLESGLTVVIYSGQLDLICCTTGTLAWMRKLTWSGMKEFQEAKKIPLYPPSGEADKNTGGFLQYHRNLYFYWIVDAGHMVPKDNGEMALEMVTRIIQ